MPRLPTVVLALVLSVASSLAAAEGPRKYAVLSLIGDALTVVTYHPATGSHLDQNDHALIPLAPAELDAPTLLATENAIRRTDPTASVVLLQLPRTDPGDGAVKVLQDGQYTPTEALRSALTNAGATHLLLVSKLRAEANLRTARGSVGSGMLDGVGFYVDGQLRTVRTDTGEAGRGFLAPYAYFTVSCIDLATSQVVKQHKVTASNTISAARNKEGTDPWGALGPEQKVRILLGLVRREVAKAVPDVVAQ